MYEYPVLFPAVTNRESWRQTIEIFDDDLNQPIELRDHTLANSLYTLTLEITPAGPQLPSGAFVPNVGPYYDDDCLGNPVISASLASGAGATSNSQLSIIDVGVIQMFLPKLTFSALRGSRTYDVYMTIYEPDIDDSRQLLVGRLPVLYGGRNT